LPRRFFGACGSSCAPARFGDDDAAGAERHAVADRVRRGDVLHAIAEERLHEARRHRVEHLLRLARQRLDLAGRDDRMVVADLVVVEDALLPRPRPAFALGRTGHVGASTASASWFHAAQRRQRRAHRVDHVERQVAAVGARVGQQLLLVELLRHLERARADRPWRRFMSRCSCVRS
jgi:hypothetical protein